MGSNSSDDVIIPRADEAECSETTVEIKIKTLDSQTYTLRVNKRVPVPQLKEQIEIVTGVLSEQQRLICRGKVLKDDQLLSAYHVEDGHTLHLVVRQPIPPPSASTTGSVGSDGLPIPQADPASTTGQNRGNPVAHSVVLGTFNVADQGEGGMPDLNRILSAVFSSIGIPNIGNSSEGVDLREAGLNRLETIGLSSMLDSTRQQPDARTMRVQYDPLHGAIQLPTAVSSGPLQPPVIPDSLTTLSQYLIYLRREFIANGGGHAVDAGMHGHEEQNYNATLGSVSAQGGLPTPATLAEVMLSTRQLLIEQAGECLSQLSRQLEDQANVTTPPLRNGIQTSAMRSGALLQNLGALLLELGRTTMTLRMGQSPSDAVVNAGPAVFISTSGPNPIMVQPLPFQPGMGFSANHTGSLSAGSGLVGGSLGSGFIPRNIDIRIRTGHSMSTANVNQGEQSGTQQTSGQTGSERGPSNANFVHRVAAGVSGGQPFAREAEVRMLPVRTVVAAVPAAVSRSTSDSSNNSMGLFYPFLARVQQVTPGQTNNARGSQSSGVRNNNIPETDHRAIPDSAMQQQNLESNSEAPVRVGGSETANLFPILAASAISLASPSNTASQHHQEGLPTPNSSRQEPPGSNNHYTSGCETQNGEESVVRILGTSEQLPSAIFPSEQIHVSDIDFQVLPTTESTLPQRGTARDTERREEAPRLGTDDGIFLSRLIHQIMPYISHTSATEPNTSSQERVDVSEHRVAQDTSRQTQENSVGVGTSHSRSDPPPSPRSSKRQKVQSE